MCTLILPIYILMNFIEHTQIFFCIVYKKKKKKKRRRRKKQAKYQLQQWPDHRQFSDSDILCAHNYSDFLLYMVNHIQRPCWSLIWLILRYSQSQQEKHVIGNGIGKILMIHCVYEKKRNYDENSLSSVTLSLWK